MIDPPNQKHVAMLYESREKLAAAIADYLNEGLSRGQLCVYATVYYRDEGHLEEFSTLIQSYDEHIKKGNLLVVDLAPFYISALIGDMKPFEEAKKLFAARAKERDDKHVRFIGDGTGFMFKNKHFDECALLEEWWQNKPFEGSYVCPFDKQSFNAFPHKMHSKRAIVATHDVVLDADSLLEQSIPSDQVNTQQQQSLIIQDYNSDENRFNERGKLI